MECGDKGLGEAGVVEQAINAGTHLLGRFVSKGDREDGVGGHAFFADEPGNAAGDYACLSGAGAGKDEQGTFRSFNGGALFGIQIVDERLQGVSPAGRILLLVYRRRRSAGALG